MKGNLVNLELTGKTANPRPGYLTGGIANSGLINFSKGLADLGAPSSILVTAVSPAATATARWESRIAQQAASAGKTIDEQRADAASRIRSSGSRPPRTLPISRASSYRRAPRSSLASASPSTAAPRAESICNLDAFWLLDMRRNLHP
jgi:NAD(P)-dependent dehydrogenase (short-subunit alcohol dehydrogenase family)